jgi:hypothetical protein
MGRTGRADGWRHDREEVGIYAETEALQPNQSPDNFFLAGFQSGNAFLSLGAVPSGPGDA